ncbi:MAG: sulfatase [Phycisphaeraceae bacterium]
MPETDTRPNILWITIEHHRYDAIGALNNPHVRTPNLDRLVAEGTAFTRAYCQSTVCVPSRASFLTGRYPAATKVRQNGQDIPPTERLFPRHARDHGYDTALFGKLHVSHAFTGEEPRIDDGYRVFEWSHAPLRHFGGAYRAWVEKQGGDYDTLYRSGEVLNAQVCADARLHQTTWCFQRAGEFIEHEATGPWLVSINPFALHDPFQFLPEYYQRYDPDSLPPPLFREGELATKPEVVRAAQHGSGFDRRGFAETTEREHREMKAAYYATLEHLDAELGRLLDRLDRQRTLIVLHGDHGEMLGDHGIFAKGPYFYEGAVRVPLVFSWPGRVPAGRVNDALVELVDVVPTLCELADLSQPPGVQGRSLAPVMHGEASHREGVLCEYYNANPAKNAPDGRAHYATMWRDQRYKVIVHHGDALGELYDLERDSEEFDNLWDEPNHRELRESMVRCGFDAKVFATDPLPQRTANF